MALVTLTHEDVERLLPMADCIEVMAEALAGFARGQFDQPVRSMYHPPHAPGLLAWMPAFRSGTDAVYGMKVLCVSPDNPQRGLDAHQGAVILFDGVTGEPRALINASAITAIRTAAVSAVATRVLAREDARELALLGAGVQARWHLTAMMLVRPIERVRVASRTFGAAQAFVERMRAEASCTLVAVPDAEQAVRGADIVVTATTAREPVLDRAWLADGTHINAIGASQPTHREIDAATWAEASVFADSRASVEREAGEFAQARDQHQLGLEHIRGELGELLTGQVRGRTSAREITLFRSLGLAIEDVAAASYVLRAATRTHTGTTVNW